MYLISEIIKTCVKVKGYYRKYKNIIGITALQMVWKRLSFRMNYGNCSGNLLFLFPVNATSIRKI